MKVQKIQLATCSCEVETISHFQKEQALRDKYSDQVLESMSPSALKSLPKPLYKFELLYPKGLKVIRQIEIVESSKGRTIKKVVRPFKSGISKDKWLPYRHELLKEAKDKAILVGEGEKVADNAIAHGLVCLSLVGSGIKSKSDFTVHHTLFSEAIAHGVRQIIYLADHDEAGITQTIRFYKAWQEFGSDELDIILLPTRALFKLVRRSPEPKDDFADLVPFLTDDFKELLERLIEIEGDNYTTEILALDHQYEGLFKEEKKKELEKIYDKSDVGSNNQYALTQELINRLSNPEIPEYVRELEITQFAQQWKVNANDIRKALKARIEKDQDAEYIASVDLDDLINTPKISLDLEYLVGEAVALEFRKQAKYLNTNPDALFVSTLPSIATLIGNRQVVEVSKDTNFRVKPILRVMIVGDSGTGKSNIINAGSYAIKARDKRLLRDYAEEVEYWLSLSKEDQEKANKPIKKQYVFNNINFDGLYKNIMANGGIGLILRDELKGYFDMLQAKSGYGDYQAQDLELFEGEPISKERQNSDISYYIENPVVSILGTVQWKVLSDIFAHDNDTNGTSARWIIWCGDLPIYDRQRNNGDESWAIFQKGLLEVLTNQPIDHLLSIDNDADDYLMEWYRTKIKPIIVTTDIAQVRSKCSKLVTEAIKIAQCLHPIHYYYTSISGVAINSNSIHLETIKRACYLSEYLLKHFQYGYTLTQESLIDGQLTKILSIIERKGEVTASNIHRALGGSRSKISLDRIPELLTQLIELKHITRIATKRGFKVAIAKNNNKVTLEGKK